jgi:hypothetical protein
MSSGTTPIGHDDAIDAAQEIGVGHGDLLGRDSERDRHQHEHLAQVQCEEHGRQQRTDETSARGAGEHEQRQHRWIGAFDPRGQQGDAIGADAEEGEMPDAEDPGIAPDQVEADGDQRERQVGRQQLHAQRAEQRRQGHHDACIEQDQGRPYGQPSRHGRSGPLVPTAVAPGLAASDTATPRRRRRP